jgi:hypothetical protein
MRCNKCGKKATFKATDPYAEEFKDDPKEKLIEEWWCDKCYQERQDDI